MQHTAKNGEALWLYSMRKRFQVTHISTSDDEANEHCRKNPNAAVIAQFGPFVICANKHEGVRDDVR